LKGAGLCVDLAGVRLTNPTMLASGILGYSAETLVEVAEGGCGGVVTKSVCLKPRVGYANPTVVEASVGLINAMGLPNPGIDEFADEIREMKSKLTVPVVVSVFGFSVAEYVGVAKRAVDAGADGVELNVSCPHVKDTGSELGQDPLLLSKVVRAVKAAVDKPVLVKLTPNVTSVAELARTAERGGADALTIMNTLKAMAIDVETTMPILANRVGGLSGSAVKPIALRHVFDVYEAVEIPILGCGGISDWRDAVEFLLAGASAVQIGTAVAVKGLGVFGEVVRGIRAYLKKKGLGSVGEIVGLSHRR
jgi:dihydroorotate dehydrogenase (NAD+) catalytic subunit